MSANFSIFIEGEALLDDIVDGPNPADDDGKTNVGNRQPATGSNDREEVGQENVGNVPASDQYLINAKIIQVGQKYHRIYLQNVPPVIFLTFCFQTSPPSSNSVP